MQRNAALGSVSQRTDQFTRRSAVSNKRCFVSRPAAPGIQFSRRHGRCQSISLPRELSEYSPAAAVEQQPQSNGQMPHPHKEEKDAQLRNSVVEIWRMNSEKFSDSVAVVDPHHTPDYMLTYRQLEQEMHDLASGLQALGLTQDNKVSLFAENSARWIVADQAIMMNGAVDVVRGSVSPPDELAYILEHSESCGLVVQDNATLARLLPLVTEAALASLKFVVVLWPETDAVDKPQLVPGDATNLRCPVLLYEEVLQSGREVQADSGPFSPVIPGLEELATLVYTSGTTGKPKGVMLTHGNLLYQVHNLSQYLQPEPGSQTLSLLPPWHIYERTVTYFTFACGCRQVYTNIRRFRDDLASFPPDYLVCVPLVLDTLYQRVVAQLNKASAVRRTIATTLLAVSIACVQAQRVLQGVSLQYAVSPPPLPALVVAWMTVFLLRPLNWLANKLVLSKIRTAIGIRKLAVSGGGALASHLDDFFEAVGLTVVNGWGMTETSPVLACRIPALNVRGSVGMPMKGTEIRVVDPETKQPLADGNVGLVLVRGPGVMPGYYRNPEATAAAFPAGDGWLDTGDLGWKAPEGVSGSRMAGSVVLSGRCKDTVVLSSGENVEPAPIEDALASSPRVKHVLVVGQDRRELGALVFPDPEMLQLDEAARRAEEATITGELRRLNRQRLSYRPMENITHVGVVWEVLSVEDGTLTRTMKPRRAAILQKYKQQAEGLVGQLRA